MCVYIILSMLFLEFVFWENIVKADWVLLLIKSLILGFFSLIVQAFRNGNHSKCADSSVNN